MKKYIASTPSAEIIGSGLLPFLTSGERDMFQHVLDKHRVTAFDPTAWYPAQVSLDLQNAIRQQPGSSSALVSIGMRVVEDAPFPPMNSLEEAVTVFSQAYSMNLRGHVPDEGIHAKQVKPGHLAITNATPHSDELVYGYIYALVNRFKPAGSHPVVQFADLNAIDGDGNMVINVMY